MELSMTRHQKVLWITRTAILIALLVVLQAASISFSTALPPPFNSIVTGSIVNAMLVISVMTCGFATGATVAVVSPVFPTLLGFGPVWPLVPFIAAGNITLVALWHIIGNKSIGNKKETQDNYVSYFIALPAAAVAKFAVLYIGVVRVAVGLLLDLPEKQANMIGGMFSLPQLITASIGGACAIAIFPALKRALSLDRHAE